MKIERIIYSCHSLLNEANTSIYPTRNVEHEYVDIADVKNEQHPSSQSGRRLHDIEKKKGKIMLQLKYFILKVTK